MIKLKWAPYPDADVASYNVYRSIVGFRAKVVLPATVAGKTLRLKIDGQPTAQVITFSGTASVVDQVNAALSGGQAYLSESDPTYFYVRSDVREAPGSVEIVTGSTALAELELTPRLITERSEDVKIAVVPAPANPEDAVTYQDPDGTLQDYYAVSTVDSLNNESLKSSYRKAISSTGNLCVLEGIVTNLQGVRLTDIEVKATLVKFPHTSATATTVSLEPITTLTGCDGRFSLPLLQCALVHLEIPAVGYARNIVVPAKPYAFVTDLGVDLDYRFPLHTEV